MYIIVYNIEIQDMQTPMRSQQASIRTCLYFVPVAYGAKGVSHAPQCQHGSWTCQLHGGSMVTTFQTVFIEL
jgi:hypothetical protein